MIVKKGKTQITFVYQPHNHCRHVHVVGTFNAWEPEQGRMSRQKDGSFRKRLQLPPGEHRYKFLVDGEWVEDPDAQQKAPNEFGSMDSLVTVG